MSEDPAILEPNSLSSLLSLTEFEERIDALQDYVFVDRIEHQLAELFETQMDFTTESALNVRVKSFLVVNPTYGNVVLYPWLKTAVRILEKEDFIMTRTNRNRGKIDWQNQLKADSLKVGICGLSVGQSAAIAIAMERSAGEIRIADYDTIELTNLNRLRSSLTTLGEKKTTLTYRAIKEIDPYITVRIFDEGLTEENIDQFFNAHGKLDCAVDECDSLPIKVLIREKARDLKIPVLMETNDRGLLDVERFDLGEPSHILEICNSEMLKTASPTERHEILLRLVNFPQLSSAMQNAFSQIGKTLVSWPQLAGDVSLGAGLIANAFRKLFLTTIELQTGRYYHDVDNHFNQT